MCLHKDGHTNTRLQQLKGIDYKLLFSANQLVGCVEAVAGALRTHGDGLGRINYLHYQWVTSGPLIAVKPSALLMMY